MALDKIKIENYIIEVHNNWRGVQTLMVNRQMVSKKFSFAGTDHFFTLLEDGHDIPYVLTTKINSKSHLLADNQILIDLKRDGKMIKEDVLLNFITDQKKEKNKSKAAGIKYLKDHEIKDAIKALKRGLELDKNDPEIYFYLACCYSLEERTKEGFECIKLAVENNLNDREMILSHDMLAFIRIQDGFEGFLNANFTRYDESIFDEE